MHEVAIGQIHVLQRCQHRDAVQARDPVDAIHEVIGVHDADEDDVANHDGPPGINAEHTRQVKSTAHCHQMKQQPYLAAPETQCRPRSSPRDQCDAREEPQPLGREMKQQEQQRRLTHQMIPHPLW